MLEEEIRNREEEEREQRQIESKQEAKEKEASQEHVNYRWFACVLRLFNDPRYPITRTKPYILATSFLLKDLYTIFPANEDDKGDTSCPNPAEMTKLGLQTSALTGPTIPTTTREIPPPMRFSLNSKNLIRHVILQGSLLVFQGYSNNCRRQ